jgi:hypothetical protein
MQWEQLSFLNPNYFSRSQPFDLRSNVESDAFSQYLDSPFPGNRIHEDLALTKRSKQ